MENILSIEKAGDILGVTSAIISRFIDEKKLPSVVRADGSKGVYFNVVYDLIKTGYPLSIIEDNQVEKFTHAVQS